MKRTCLVRPTLLSVTLDRLSYVSSNVITFFLGNHKKQHILICIFSLWFLLIQMIYFHRRRSGHITKQYSHYLVAVDEAFRLFLFFLQ